MRGESLISRPLMRAGPLTLRRSASPSQTEHSTITIDEKPKRQAGRPLKRLRNIAENPAVAVVADRYDEDWTRLGWVILRGKAELLSPGGAEHARAQVLLCRRYLQLNAMHIETLPVIAVRVEDVISWGNLSVEELASLRAL